MTIKESIQLSGAVASDPIRARIDAVLDSAIEDQRLVGAVVLVARRGEIIYRKAAGVADREAGKAMRSDALFRLSSVTKPITSTAALALVAQGRIGLDDPIARWLPEFQPALADGSRVAITLRQLLSHTAGLGYGFLEARGGGAYARAGVCDGLENAPLTLDENIRRLASAPLLYRPGSAWGYSIATDVLGALIARVYGAPLAEAIEQLVSKPLGLSDTRFNVVDPTRLTAAYLNADPAPRRMQGVEVIEVFENTAGIRMDADRALDASAYPSGGSGMVGTAGEFLVLLETLRQGGGSLMSASLAKEMGSVQTGDLELANWPGRGFGLGFTVLTDAQAAQTPESVGTWRLGGAFGHSWFVDPLQQLSVVAFTNTAFEGMYGQFTLDLTHAVYGV
ncbi:serine hydrolase domain-containing protein [Pseudomonas sp. 148P]|uniref:Serine hydrolase domain-containing protein n=1 Tax=Pseudomonas ulcerans TaxID=3115852 RepID=A0ABU7HVT4_9PSED|nr:MULTISPECIES: serine hydrolase domain-containing protein [unclassified Pseudomonas]MEE1924137.1 serine hydrolase domain-containing protein [Pseudomonas sp. 147P]MEE1935536.1 serine hydrolase domain-containing protein [Pseudomonas sp. 148P]